MGMNLTKNIGRKFRVAKRNLRTIQSKIHVLSKLSNGMGWSQEVFEEGGSDESPVSSRGDSFDDGNTEGWNHRLGYTHKDTTGWKGAQRRPEAGGKLCILGSTW